MKRENIAHAATEPRVLRGVVLQTQPHTLRTPGGTQLTWASDLRADDVPMGSDKAHSNAYLAGHQAGLAEGLSQGRQEGLRQAAQDQAHANEKAVNDAHAAAAEMGHREGLERGLAEGRAGAAERERLAIEAAVAEATQALSDERTALAAQREALAEEHDGLAAERASLSREHAQRLSQLEALLAAVPAQIQEQLAQVEDDMLALCHDVICTVLGRQAAAPDTLRTMLREARGKLHEPDSLAVHVHPDDHAALMHETRAPGEPGVTWVADPTVELGGLSLRSAQGSLDARLEVQLAQLRSTLFAVREQRRLDTTQSSGERA